MDKHRIEEKEENAGKKAIFNGDEASIFIKQHFKREMVKKQS